MRKTKGSEAKSVLLAVTVGVLLAPNAVEGQTNSQAAALLRKTEQLFNFDASTAFVTKSTRAAGRVVGEGPANQNTLDLNVGSNLTGTVWTDYDFTSGKLNEIDLYLTAHGKLGEIKKGAFKGSFTWSLGFQDWKYPSRLLGSHDDYVLLSSITYNGPVTVSLVNRHLLDDYWSWDRNCLKLDLSTSIKAADLFGGTLTLSPCVSAAYNDNFAGDTGYRYITYGLAATWSRGAYSISGFVKEQRNISDMVRSLPYAGVSITISDLKEGFRQLRRR